VDLDLELAAGPLAPARARAAIDEIAGALAPALLDDLRLVVSELVANAILHGPDAPVRLRLHADGPGRVRGEVADQGRDGTIAIRESADEGGGYGLRLVDRLAHRWGVHEGSTHVWFELRD
jgi:anti-sigma regulatory factor (Ser/Thr protein kinase)